jgi:hypothetical protein
MSYLGEKIFTDVVKDTIGDEPVLDQHEIENPFSYYLSISDFFHTGVVLQYPANRIANNRSFIIDQGSSSPTRGAYGLSNGQPASKILMSYGFQDDGNVTQDYTQESISRNPSRAFRAIPWSERMKGSQKFTSFIDEKERFYDTCLPSFAKSLIADGTSPWVISDVDPSLWLSPYGNTIHTNVAYLRFNDKKLDHAGQTNNSSDPLTNNDWTWSYPYESRYNPEVRYLNTETALGLNSTQLTTTWQPTPFLDVKYNSHPISYTNFLPLFAGRNDSSNLGSGGSNGLRNSDYLPTGSMFDSKYGTSYIIPADVYLNQIVDHTSFGGYAPPGNEYFTGSSSTNDLLKVIYGFGDNNNVGYVYNDVDVDKSGSFYYTNYSEVELGTKAELIGDVTSQTGSIYWSASSLIPADVSPWTVLARDGSMTKIGKTYNFISGNVLWQGSNNILASDTSDHGGLVAGKESTFYLDITSSNPWSICYSRAVAGPTSDFLEVYFSRRKTESLDTSAKYPIDRVIGDGGLYNVTRYLAPFTSSYVYQPGEYRLNVTYVKDNPTVAFEGNPSILQTAVNALFPNNTQFQSTITPSVNTVNALAASLNQAGTTTLAANQSLFSNPNLIAGITSQNKINAINPSILGVSTPNANVSKIPAAILSKAAQIAIQSGSTTNQIDRAFISEINLVSWDAVGSETVYNQSQAFRVGANNYPKFHRVEVDPRSCPLFPGTQAQIDASSHFYKSYNYGLAPIIRGWKYGLYSAIPTNTRAVFRRNRFGNFRDMLEQRQYSKFIYEKVTHVENSPVPPTDAIYEVDAENSVKPGDISLPVVSVRFVKRKYKLEPGSKNIGQLYNVTVAPELTLSHNLSPEVTSSLPYFDDMARSRSESSYLQSKNAAVVVASYDFDLNSGLVIQ